MIRAATVERGHDASGTAASGGHGTASVPRPVTAADLPEPFTAVPVVLEDGRHTWAVWTGRKWWGEHHELRVIGWRAVVNAAARREA